ncbi:hypothetical protein AUC68_04340 [Methyloceanibacter methanicus]|uniref:Uncharacterized protein n=1 Tax=Methyloceanibacter methanicus TaxID=1774968 RepID=A0A1E3W0B9_9HYPH|nr:hypothetical protein AUC68_04340 [Methyloceanibacter methanicus]
MGIARGGQALADTGDAPVQVGVEGLGHARPDQNKQRAQALEALPRAVDPLMAVRRRGQRCVGDVQLGQGNRAQRLAHGQGRVKLVTHRSPASVNLR